MREKTARKYTPFIIFILMFLYLIAGLIKVQVVEQAQHKELLVDLLGTSNYSRGLRGNIYSSDGVKLAWSEQIPTISLKNYGDKDNAELRKYLTTEQIVSIRNTGQAELSWEQAFLLKSIGYEISTVEKRRSYGFLYHIIGSVNVDGDGVSGMEGIYNDLLKGKVSISYGVGSPGGGYKQGIIENVGENGMDLQATINYKLQKFSYDLLTELATPSVIIVSNVQTGDILTMASYPAPEIDMNSLDLISWEKILNDQLTPLLNRAISNTYPPGSAFKVITAFAQLLYGNPQTVKCNGIYTYRDSKGRVTGKYKDWLLSGHGIVDLKKALRVSCNVYFYNAALDVGAENIAKVAKAFYLGQKTGINLPGEASGTLPSPEWKVENIGENWYPGDTILYGIGQGFFTITPLQMITLYNTIANRGIFVKPKLLINEEIVKKEILLDIPDAYWDLVIQGLEEVTTVQGSGTNAGTAAASFKGFPITVAGKTGTAQVGSGQPHAWFVGFAPSRQPMYSVVVLVEHGESGGLFAAPIARKIFDYMYQNGFFKDSQSNQKSGTSKNSN
ncbi:MAG TPA: peptidoglycan glycosyltransferase [Fervidobacterium sp.]|nr:peptidoglycan glycosyltransferase [Fervidobacterium sp.]